MVVTARGRAGPRWRLLLSPLSRSGSVTGLRLSARYFVRGRTRSSIARWRSWVACCSTSRVARALGVGKVAPDEAQRSNEPNNDVGLREDGERQWPARRNKARQQRKAPRPRTPMLLNPRRPRRPARRSGDGNGSGHLGFRSEALMCLNRSGFKQLCILETIGEDLLSDGARALLGLMRRKFPCASVPLPDHREAHYVGSPIRRDNAAHVTDAQWLCAMERYGSDGISINE